MRAFDWQVANVENQATMEVGLKGVDWEWKSQNPVDSILWPIAQSAADLLTSPDLAAVRMCEAPDCAWLFLDQSRNRSRRWCDMKVCGNRQKARRHYQRMHR